jgi:HEAT repeat protein
MLDAGDTGLFPEPEMHRRARGTTPYDMVQSSPSLLREITSAAEAVGKTGLADTALAKHLAHADPVVRYWAVMALAQLPQERTLPDLVRPLLQDESPSVRYASAGLLARETAESAPLKTLVQGLKDKEETAALYAARELEHLGPRAQAALKEIAQARQENLNSERSRDYKMFIDWALTESMRRCGQDTDYLMKF